MDFMFDADLQRAKRVVIITGAGDGLVKVNALFFAVQYWREQAKGGAKLSIADGWRKGPERDKGGRWQVEEIGAAVEQLIGEAVPAQKVYGS